MNYQTAERLYKYRKANGYSQADIADMLGVSRQAVSKWERGESSPDTDNLIALAKLYNVTIDEMINGSSQPEKTTPPPAENNYADYSYQQPVEQNNNNNSDYYNNSSDYYYEDRNQNTFHHNHNKKPSSNSGLHAIIPLFAVAFYLFVGFTTNKGWGSGWIIFLLIPIVETLLNAIKTKNPSAFAYPVLVAAVYLVVGMLFSIWHPTWLLFITIPVYYILADSFKKLRHGNGKQSTASIIISTVFSIIIIGMIIVSCFFGLFSIPSGSSTSRYDENEYSIGEQNISIDDDISNININWISGNVDIEYYDEKTVSFSESGVFANENYKMRYKVSNSTLYIEYCKSGLKTLSNTSKNLTVFIPRGKELSNLNISTVSSDVNINELTVTKSFDLNNVSGDIHADGTFGNVDFDNVSGNIYITGSEVTQKIEGDTVSGDCKIAMPENTDGFSIEFDTVSGRVSSSDFDGYKSEKMGDHEHTYNSGNTSISVSSISGDLDVIKG